MWVVSIERIQLDHVLPVQNGRLICYGCLDYVADKFNTRRFSGHRKQCLRLIEGDDYGGGKNVSSISDKGNILIFILDLSVYLVNNLVLFYSKEMHPPRVFCLLIWNLTVHRLFLKRIQIIY